MRKLSQINELWSKDLDRSKSGHVRLEDKITSNIDTFKEVDLGLDYVFADIDLIINDNDHFTWEDYMSFKKYILSTGWRLPSWDDLQGKLLLKEHNSGFMDKYVIDYERDKNNYVHIFIISGDNGTLDFKLDNPHTQAYWCEICQFDKDKDVSNYKNMRCFRIYDPHYGQNILTCENEPKTSNKVKIRLIKDK